MEALPLSALQCVKDRGHFHRENPWVNPWRIHGTWKKPDIDPPKFVEMVGPHLLTPNSPTIDPAKRGESDEHRISNGLQLGRCFASSQQAVQPIEGVQMSKNVNTLVNGLV